MMNAECRISRVILSGARTRAQSKDLASDVEERRRKHSSVTHWQDPSTPASTPALRMTGRHSAFFIHPSAFTLTEILVVIVIIVLLLGMAMPVFHFITGSRSEE